MKITIKLDSIVKQEVDAIVNPANSFGFMGGGVAGVLKKIGGDQIEEEAIENAPIEIGQALATSAGDLKCGCIIHAPTMRNPAEKTNERCVEEATQAALELADEMKLQKIAMPGMGTGVGGVSFREAAAVMIKTIKSFEAKSLKEVILVDINEEMVDAWKESIQI